MVSTQGTTGVCTARFPLGWCFGRYGKLPLALKPQIQITHWKPPKAITSYFKVLGDKKFQSLSLWLTPFPVALKEHRKGTNPLRPFGRSPTPIDSLRKARVSAPQLAGACFVAGHLALRTGAAICSTVVKGKTTAWWPPAIRFLSLLAF